jgi:uncharacterized protein
MKHKALISFLVLVTLVAGAYIAGMKLAGQYGAYLAQAYMLTPALAALLTRLFFDRRRFSDANLRFGRLKDYGRFWLASLAIVVLYFVAYTLLGAGRWDFSGGAFLARLSDQFAAAGQDINDTLPSGMTPQSMLLIFFIGGLTVFNILPGLVTGFGEEFGWRGLMFPRLYAVSPWLAFVGGALIWYAWHLPLGLLAPQHLQPEQVLPNLAIMAVGSVGTFAYLAYVYVRSRSVWVTALAHIVLNNASASFGYLFILEDQFLANLGTVLVMALVAAGLVATGRTTASRDYFDAAPPIGTASAPGPAALKGT